MSDLKCPFCGGGVDHQFFMPDGAGDYEGEHHFICDGCEVLVLVLDMLAEEEAMSLYNKRVVVVNVNEEIITVLEMAKHEHYDGGYEGLTGCDAIGGGECDCGAAGINARIDQLIKKLREE